MKKNLLMLIPVTVFCLSLFSGCATILSGSSQDMMFDSEPRGAQVIIDGSIMGKTPVSVNLKKSKYKEVQLKLDGFETQVRPLSKSYDPVTLVNIFWDLSTTDLITGNAYQYEPNSYYFVLEKK